MEAKRKKRFDFAKKTVTEDASFMDKLKAAGRMIQAQMKGTFKIKSQTIFIVVGAIIYTVVPFDFDFVPFIGWIDDLTILTYAFTQFNKEVARFLAWETKENPYPDLDIIDAEIVE